MQLNIFQSICFDAWVYLESITWDCSKKGWKALPITQAGTCGKVTHL